MRHAQHEQILGRLRRAKGHLESVIAMIEQQRPCVDVAQQLKAVESAVANAKHLFIHDHIDHCVTVSDDDVSDGGIESVKQISKFL